MSFTSVIRYVKALDTSVTTGAGKGGLAFGDFTAKYIRKGGTLTSLTPQDITTLGTYQAPTANTNIRIKEVNSADPTKGVYEVHFHDDQTADTATHLWLFLSASGAVIQPYEMELSDYRLPNALAGETGGLPLDDDVVAIKAKTDNLPSDPADASVIAGRFDTVDTNIADVEGKVDDLEARLGTPSDLGSGATVAANLVDIEGQTDDIGAAGAGLTAADDAILAELAKVPKSDSNVTWNATAAAQLQSEATDALNAYDGPTKAELDAGLDALPTAAEITTAAWTTALTEAYRATGATGTAAQLLYEILGNIINFNNVGTLKTVTKLDKSTDAKTYTYDDATTPTAIEETT